MPPLVVEEIVDSHEADERHHERRNTRDQNEEVSDHDQYFLEAPSSDWEPEPLVESKFDGVGEQHDVGCVDDNQEIIHVVDERPWHEDHIADNPSAACHDIGTESSPNNHPIF